MENVVFENELLKKLFNLDGEYNGGTASSFDFDLQNDPYYVVIELKGDNAELRERYARGMFEHTNTKKLSGEDIKKLKEIGYRWD